MNLLPRVRTHNLTRPRRRTARQHLSILLNVQNTRTTDTGSRPAGNVRSIGESHSAELREGNQLCGAAAVDGLEVLDDPFGVFFAQGRLAAEGVGDGFAGGFVGDVAGTLRYGLWGWLDGFDLRCPTGLGVCDDFHVDRVAWVDGDFEVVGVLREPFVPGGVLGLAAFDYPVDTYSVVSMAVSKLGAFLAYRSAEWKLSKCRHQCQSMRNHHIPSYCCHQMALRSLGSWLFPRPA